MNTAPLFELSLGHLITLLVILLMAIGGLALYIYQRHIKELEDVKHTTKERDKAIHTALEHCRGESMVFRVAQTQLGQSNKIAVELFRKDVEHIKEDISHIREDMLTRQDEVRDGINILIEHMIALDTKISKNSVKKE